MNKDIRTDQCTQCQGAISYEIVQKPHYSDSITGDREGGKTMFFPALRNAFTRCEQCGTEYKLRMDAFGNVFKMRI